MKLRSMLLLLKCLKEALISCPISLNNFNENLIVLSLVWFRTPELGFFFTSLHCFLNGCQEKDHIEVHLKLGGKNCFNEGPK